MEKWRKNGTSAQAFAKERPVLASINILRKEKNAQTIYHLKKSNILYLLNISKNIFNYIKNMVRYLKYSYILDMGSCRSGIRIPQILSVIPSAIYGLMSITKLKFCFLLVSILIINCNSKDGSTIKKKEEIVSINSVVPQSENLIDEEQSIDLKEKLTDPRNQYIYIDPLYKCYQYSFESLSSDEILNYSYSYGMRNEEYKINNDEYMFQLTAKNTVTEEERILGYWNVLYGNCQLSHDRKSGIFVLYSDSLKMTEPLFKVDGCSGIVEYLFNKTSSYMGNKDLTYLLFDYDNRSLFILADINKKEFVRTIEWRKSEEPWGSGVYRIFRSLDPQYNFRIDLCQEHPYIFATAYYNVENDQLDTVFDVTGSISYDDAREREKIIPEEIGK